MDNLISVLIADDNIEFGNVLREYIDNNEGLYVKGIARDGLEAIEMMKEHTPDVVILDLIMPNLDGIGVLERIHSQQLKCSSVMIVLSAVGQDGFIQKAIELGADYYMVKPFDVDMLVKRIKQLHGEKAASQKTYVHGAIPGDLIHSHMENKLEIIITGLIKEMGIIPNLAGFHYLREAVMISVENPGFLASVTRSIYPVIAQKHNTTETQVNRAIRNAIKISFEKTKGTADKNILTPAYHKKDKSNVSIISSLANKAILRLT